MHRRKPGHCLLIAAAAACGAWLVGPQAAEAGRLMAPVRMEYGSGGYVSTAKEPLRSDQGDLATLAESTLRLLNAGLTPGEPPVGRLHVFGHGKDVGRRGGRPLANGTGNDLLRPAARLSRLFSHLPLDEAGIRRFHLFQRDRPTSRRKPRAAADFELPPGSRGTLLDEAYDLGTGGGPAAVDLHPVPEPAAWTLCGMAFAVGCCGRRGRGRCAS